jgi:hypothetical protein
MICIPSPETPRIQECHILTGHIICEIVERAFSEDSLTRDRGRSESSEFRARSLGISGCRETLRWLEEAIMGSTERVFKAIALAQTT